MADDEQSTQPEVTQENNDKVSDDSKVGSNEEETAAVNGEEKDETQKSNDDKNQNSDKDNSEGEDKSKIEAENDNEQNKEPEEPPLQSNDGPPQESNDGNKEEPNESKNEKPPLDDAPPAYEEVPSSSTKTPVIINDDNFWLDGRYKTVTKRIEDGGKVLDDIIKMLHERAEIENMYGNKLRGWCQKWQETVHKSGEYGTISTSLRSSFKEGVSLSDLHFSINGKLEEISKNVQDWKGQHYPKSLTKYKEYKRSDEAFIKAQKPWLLKYNEVNSCKKAYYDANSLRDNTKQQEEEAKQNPTINADQLTKISTKLTKAEQDIVMTREKYKDSLRDIAGYNNKYIEDMKYEYGKCQAFEEERRTLIKEKLLLFQACVNRCMFNGSYESIYKEMESTFNTIDVENDLKDFEKKCGPSHPFVHLEFIEYDPNIHASSNSSDTNQRNHGKKKSGICTTL